MGACWRERILHRRIQNTRAKKQNVEHATSGKQQATRKKQAALPTTIPRTMHTTINKQEATSTRTPPLRHSSWILADRGIASGRLWGTRQVSIPLFLSVKRQILLSLFDGAGRSGRSKICIINSEKCSIASIFTTRAREFGIPLSLLVRNAVISHFPFIHLIFNPLTNPHSQYRNNKLPTFHPSTKNYEPSTP